MIYKEIINLKNFIYICFFISSIISFDIIIQFFLGHNLIGNTPVTFPGMVYYTGFFNKELIAGGFILMFGLLGVDFGHGYDPLPGTLEKSGWQTHFSIGQQF